MNALKVGMQQFISRTLAQRKAGLTTGALAQGANSLHNTQWSFSNLLHSG